jgi:hypothetical protein
MTRDERWMEIATKVQRFAGRCSGADAYQLGRLTALLRMADFVSVELTDELRRLGAPGELLELIDALPPRCEAT